MKSNYVSEKEEKVAIDSMNTMLDFLRIGGMKSNIPVLKEYLEYLKQLLTQKTAGQRKDKPKDIAFDDFWVIITVICVESMALYLSGDLDKIESLSNNE